jgi:hypothetical protein
MLHPHQPLIQTFSSYPAKNSLGKNLGNTINNTLNIRNKTTFTTPFFSRSVQPYYGTPNYNIKNRQQNVIAQVNNKTC